ncbi:MAG: alpha/beta hydrolase [Croceibacterium sp.]
MTTLKASALAFIALLAAVIAGPVQAQPAPQDTPDIVGEWHGNAAVATGDQMMALTVTRGADGTLAGEFENRDVAPGRRAPVSEIVATNGRLTFKIGGINATYEATWDEAAQEWRGTISRGATPLRFSRGLPPAKPRIEGLDGLWEATVEANGTRLRQILRISSGEWGTNLVMDSPDQYVSNVVLPDLAREGRVVRFSAPRRAGRFEGILSEDGDELAGAFKVGEQQSPITFIRTQATAETAPPRRPQNPTEPVPYRQEEVAFDNPAAHGVHLFGTLTLPQGQGPFPVAILLSGSGQHDRDETLDGHKPFLVIADHLTRGGIAVLRFDDRGSGKSTGQAYDATSGDKASDANAAFAYLLGRTDVRHDAIGFIGHSEGGLIGPIAMACNDKVAFLVSLAGPATDTIDLMLSQRRIMTGGEGVSEEQLARSEAFNVAEWKALAAAETLEAGRAALLELLTPETKAALGLPPETDSALILREMMRARVWYLARYDPVPNLARVSVPVLAQNGSLDHQTEPKSNLDAWRARLTGSRDVTVLELPGLNHMFQHARTGGRGEYRDIEETFAPEALSLMAQWLKQRFLND